jgi:hypothetical protein
MSQLNIWPASRAFERGVSGRRHRPVLQRILPARTANPAWLWRLSPNLVFDNSTGAENGLRREHKSFGSLHRSTDQQGNFFLHRGIHAASACQHVRGRVGELSFLPPLKIRFILRFLIPALFVYRSHAAGRLEEQSP